jgi:putative membrane protein
MSAWDLLVFGLLLALGMLYGLGCAALRRARAGRPLEHAAFWIGWTAMVLSIAPPLDGLVVQLFSAHMFQHELMMLLGAPLVIAGRPLPVWLHALPRRRRHAIVRAARHAGVAATWWAATNPPVAWALHGTVIWVWHIPALYALAVRSEAVHFVQHAMFIGTSMLFWWGLLYGRYGRAGYGSAIIYVFTTAVHTGALGAGLTFAPRTLYDVYAGPAAARGISALHDQQVAGLLMWIPAGLLFTLFGLGLLAAWLGASGRSLAGPRLRQRRAG